MREFNVFRKDNTEGFTQAQLDNMNKYYKEQVVTYDSTSDVYEDEIQNLQERILKLF